MPPTPQYCWPLLCQEAGTEVWLKHENHTPVGAFKVRGGLVYFAGLHDVPGDVDSADQRVLAQDLALAAAGERVLVVDAGTGGADDQLARHQVIQPDVVDAPACRLAFGMHAVGAESFGDGHGRLRCGRSAIIAGRCNHLHACGLGGGIIRRRIKDPLR